MTPLSQECGREKWTKSKGSLLSDVSLSRQSNPVGIPVGGAFKAGVWFCDMIAVSSGNGAFGNQARREIARDAFFDIMSETKTIACDHSTKGDAAVTND